MITIKIAMRHWWQDDRLAWNPDDYDGISSISMNHDQEASSPCVRTPDLETYTNVETALELLRPRVYVWSSGAVYMNRFGILKG